MKYKVGDKVRIRRDLEVGREYGDFEFVNEMMKFRGKSMIVEKVYLSSYDLVGGDKFYFTDEMFEGVETMNIKIESDGKIVTAQMGDKYGVAKCSPEDEFDIFVGAKLALERLEEKCKPYAWLKDNTLYYIPETSRAVLFTVTRYCSDNEYDERMKKRGLVFKTKEEAVEAAKKMLAALKESDSNE